MHRNYENMEKRRARLEDKDENDAELRDKTFA